MWLAAAWAPLGRRREESVLAGWHTAVARVCFCQHCTAASHTLPANVSLKSFAATARPSAIPLRVLLATR